MAKIIQFPVTQLPTEEPQQIARPARVKVSGASFVDPTPPRRNHAAEPIKDVNDIYKVQDYLVTAKRFRDNLLFTAGINFGLRAGDLLQLKVGHLLNDDGNSYKDEIVIQEGKTSKYRTLYLNDAVMDAADLYFSDLQKNKQLIDPNDYLFRSLSNNKSKQVEIDGQKVMKKRTLNEPMAVRSAEALLKEVINDKCHIDVHASTHCLRKTFAYHVITTAEDRPRAVEFLQKIFGHSTQTVTLFYAGITDDEIKGTYQKLNLGRGYDLGVSSGLMAEQRTVRIG